MRGLEEVFARQPTSITPLSEPLEPDLMLSQLPPLVTADVHAIVAVVVLVTRKRVCPACEGIVRVVGPTDRLGATPLVTSMYIAPGYGFSSPSFEAIIRRLWVVPSGALV